MTEQTNWELQATVRTMEAALEAIDNTERLIRLVNDILDLERIKSGKIKIQKEQCYALKL